jgi:hypothetical protein
LQADDINGVVALLSDDAWLRMSPSRREYRGQNAVGTCLRELAGGAAVVDSTHAHAREHPTRVRDLVTTWARKTSPSLPTRSEAEVRMTVPE